jgi:hypothetical protein
MKQGYNTNLAAEYYVLSMLYRKGLNAYLTLGNKKSVDIIIENSAGGLHTVDVKGLAGTTSWPMDNFKKIKKNHFIVLVTFLNKIEEHEIAPECWVIPAQKVERLLYRNPKGNRQVLERRIMVKKGQKYRQNWNLLK